MLCIGQLKHCKPNTVNFDLIISTFSSAKLYYKCKTAVVDLPSLLHSFPLKHITIQVIFWCPLVSLFHRLSRPAPNVSHASLPRAAHHGLLTYEHVQQGLRQHGGQPWHDHAGRHLVSGGTLQDWGGGELLQPQAIWDQGGVRLSKPVVDYCSVNDWLTKPLGWIYRQNS